MGKTMREVFGRTLQDMKEDPKLVVLDADSRSFVVRFFSVSLRYYRDCSTTRVF